MEAQTSLKIKLQLLCGDGYAMGPGKADLLEAIAREGSISAAGRALGMSYRRTWLLVDEMNRCFSEKLVETLSGGGRERGARVTQGGQTILAAYRALQHEAASLLESDAYARLTRHLLEMPLPAKNVPDPD
ncbi:MAG: LysR family transcriptional regulator [Sphingobium sp.]